MIRDLLDSRDGRRMGVPRRFCISGQAPVDKDDGPAIPDVAEKHTHLTRFSRFARR